MPENPTPAVLCPMQVAPLRRCPIAPPRGMPGCAASGRREEEEEWSWCPGPSPRHVNAGVALHTLYPRSSPLRCTAVYQWACTGVYIRYIRPAGLTADGCRVFTRSIIYAQLFDDVWYFTLSKVEGSMVHVVYELEYSSWPQPAFRSIQKNVPRVSSS